MKCKHCGKIVSSDLGICPFCGVMANTRKTIKDQSDITNFSRPQLLTEKYGIKHVEYEKRKEGNEILFTIICISVVLLLILAVILLIIIIQ